MTARHWAAEHHASATNHHEQAARYHRDASRHYQVGQDYAHAAHQALIAHGHALLAIERGNEASRYYAEHDDRPLSGPADPAPHLPAKSIETPGTMTTNLSDVTHHAAAADHHDEAARHHGNAAGHGERKDFALAVEEAEMARGHARQAVFHGDEAAKHHAEHYGKSGPTAEIL